MKMDRTYYAQFHRLLELDKRIRADGYPNALSFSQEWEVSQKTVQRDIEFLRDSLAAPLGYDRVKKGYYYTDKNWFLPALNIRQSEIEALMMAEMIIDEFRGTPLAAELKRVLEKLIDSRPEPLPVRPELIAERFSFVQPAAKPANPEIWRALVDAVLFGKTIQITYRSLNSGKKSERVIDPYHVANLHGEWYVFAHCHTARGLRQFGIPQIQSVKPTGKTFQIPANFVPKKLLANAFRRQVLGEKVYKVKLRFDKSIADRVLERQWHPRQKTKRLANGDLALSFATPGLFEVSRWVLSWGRRVTIVSPTELIDMVNLETTTLIKREKI